jgi:hypothetical protein
MYLVGICQANCFKTHHELTMYLLGNYPLAPSATRLSMSTLRYLVMYSKASKAERVAEMVETVGHIGTAGCAEVTE